MNENGLAHTVDWCKLSRLHGIDTLEGYDVINIPVKTNRSGKNIMVDRRVIDTCHPYFNYIYPYHFEFAVQSV